nr:hypothetical protein [Pyrinomonadaceae bacterium]
TFYGDRITYVYNKAFNRGRAAITIDGKDLGYIDLYSPTLQWQQSTTFDGLGWNIHTINISVTGQKGTSATDSFVDVDKLTITGGNSFVGVELRVDTIPITHAGKYSHRLWAGIERSDRAQEGEFVTAWFSVNLAPYQHDSAGTTIVYSGKFSQVGLMVTATGIRWFVYSEAKVECLRGTKYWGDIGCLGEVSDLVDDGYWHTVELVSTGQGYWLARVEGVE